MARGKGEGTIGKRADGRWYAALTLPDGTRRWRYGATRKEAQRKLDDLRAAVARGQDLHTGQQTVEQFLRQWLETVSDGLRPSTHTRYAQLIEDYALPALGGKRLDRVNGQALAALYLERGRAGAAPASIELLHTVLHRAFKDAVRWGLLDANPCDRADPPRRRKAPKRTLSPAEARRLLAVATDDGMHALWLLAVTTGMRRGEILALHWEDLDLDLGRLHIRRTLSRGERGWVEMPPKTQKGNRPISLLPPVVAALREHCERLPGMRRAAGAEWVETGLVFCTRTGRHLSPAWVSDVVLPRLLARANCPKIPFHNLRHSAATLLLSLGVHPRVVGDLLGHSSISITMDTYTHAVDGLQQEAVERLGKLLLE